MADPNSEYTQATQSYVFFNSNLVVDVLKVDTDISPTFREAIANKEKMLSTTTLHNSFEERIDSRYFSPEGQTAGANYTVYRRTPYQTYYDFVCVMRDGEYIFYDYNINNHNYYHYLCSIEVETSAGYEYYLYQSRDDTGELEYVETRWDDWSICDIEDTMEDNIYVKTGNVWNFKGNITNESLTQNTSITVWDTLGVYPKMSIGQKNYDSSSLSCMLGDVTEYSKFKNQVDEENGETVVKSSRHYGYTEKIHLHERYGREMEKLIAWREFCNNGKLKLLKDTKGHAWIVQITDNPSRSIEVRSERMPTTISFNWTEVEDISSVSIIVIGE